MEVVIGLIIGVVLALLGVKVARHETPPPPSVDVQASKERVDDAESEAEAERERIRKEIQNESVESVVGHFFNVFSDPPPSRRRD